MTVQKLLKHKLKYEVPFLIEKVKDGGSDGLKITGTAIKETISRNKVKYEAKELENAAISLKDKPILDSHNQNSITDILGKVTSAWYDAGEKAVKFEGLLKNGTARTMVEDGLISKVSIGAMASELVKESEGDQNYVIARGIEFLELSLVAVEGVVGASFTHSLDEAFKLEEAEGDKPPASMSDCMAMMTGRGMPESEAMQKCEALMKIKKKESKEDTMAEQNFDDLAAKVSEKVLAQVADLLKKQSDTASTQAEEAAKKETEKLREQLKQVEQERKTNLVSELVVAEVKAGIVKEAEIKAESEKLANLDESALKLLKERVSNMKAPETNTVKGKVAVEKVGHFSEADEGDLIVERTREGISLWRKPATASHILKGENYGVR